MQSKIKEIDRFYFLLGAVLAVTALVTILFLRTMFSAFSLANSYSEETSGSEIPHLDRKTLEEIHSKLYVKNPPRLDL